MDKIGLAITMLIAFGGAAIAADLPARTYTKAPSISASISPWDGFYVGGNIGAAWTRDSGVPRCTDPAGVANGPICQNVPASTIDASGIIGGAQLGYNWQIAPSWILGMEADIQAANVNGSAVVDGPFQLFLGPLALPAAQFTASEKLDWLGTVRGRVGWVMGPALLYATGGLAYGHARLNTNLITPGIFAFPADESVTKVGWTAGGGVEWAFSKDWSAKLEGLYYDLGTTTVMAGPLVPGPGITGFLRGKDFELHGAIARVGLNYHFGSPAGAKY